MSKCKIYLQRMSNVLLQYMDNFMLLKDTI